MTQKRPTDPNAIPPVTVRPKKGSALERIVDSVKGSGRGAVSDLIHGWADRHEDAAQPAPPPDIASFD